MTTLLHLSKGPSLIARVSVMAAVPLSLLFWSRNGWAQECLVNEDCDDPTMVCQRDDDEVPPCAVDEECPEATPGTCVVDPLRCATDEDCDEGYACELVGESSTGCAPSPDDSGCENDPVTTEYRECVFQPLTCETNADCASGLTCEQRQVSECSASVSPGGETVDEGCETTTERTCTWAPPECSDDSDCAANEECVTLEEQLCSVSSCAPGEDCETTETCEPSLLANICFPTQRACASDSDCASGEVCFDLATETEETIPFWEEGQGSEFCFSEGIVLAIQGRADVGGVLEGEGSSRSDATKGSSQASEDEASGQEPASDDGGSANSGGGGGGCSVAAGNPSTSFAGSLLLALGVWGSRRRRTVTGRARR